MNDDQKETTQQDLVALMREIQQDEHAFALLSWRVLKEGDRGLNFGDALREFGDPRFWPEYTPIRKSANVE